MTYRLFLDDERDPPERETDWVIARSYKQAVEIVMERGWPNWVQFDHDLGLGPSGYDFAQWLVKYDMDRGGMPNDFQFDSHSMNPVGARAIIDYLRNYLDFKNGVE